MTGWTRTGVVVGAAALAVAGYFALPQRVKAPEFRFLTLSGEAISTSQLRGKVVLVNFWATSCVACVHEMPRIAETHRRYRDQGFETIAVAMSYDPPNHVLNYAGKNRLPFRIAHDRNGELAAQFGAVRFTPTTFIIDRRGNIAKRYVGEPDFARLHELLESKLKEPS